MTEKRFTLEEFGLNFIVKDNGRNLTAKQTVGRLNELNDENEQLKQENRLLKGRIEGYIEQVNDSTKSRNDKEKSCGYCKNYNLDGMFGIWCSIHETPTSNKYCQDFEWNR